MMKIDPGSGPTDREALPVQSVILPRSDVNDDTATLVRWLYAEGAQVSVGAPLCILETSKTVFEVCAPQAGFLHRVVPEASEVAVEGVLAFICESADERPVEAARKVIPVEVQATRAARALAEQHHLDLASLGKSGIITTDDLLPLLKRAASRPYYHPHPGLNRVILIGAGRVAMQIIDILLHVPHTVAVGCLDDRAEMQGQLILGVPVVGRTEQLEQLHRDKFFTQAVVAVGTDLKARRRLFYFCQTLGIPLANVIDPTARINRQVVMGTGNILCSFVHVGVAASLGDNCFLAAHTNVDHHCELGSHILLGPGCLLSGTVSVGDDTLMGSGVIIQPNLSVGEGCLVASGAVITADVPDHHSVKTRVSTTVVAR